MLRAKSFCSINLLALLALICFIMVESAVETGNEEAQLFGYNANQSVHLIKPPDGLLKANATPSNETDDPHRIIGGYQINISQAPYQVAVFLDKEIICGGSIISSRWIVTAAHCVVTRGTYSIQAGSRYYKNFGQRRQVSLIVKNADFNIKTMNMDIALMKVNPFKFNKNVRPIRLPKSYLRKRPRTYLVSGWGLRRANAENYPTVLYATDVNYIERKRCSKLYRKKGIPITKNMICAASKGKDACTGDSGGPMAHDNILFGIVSFGEGCGDINYPGVYTNVANCIPWIEYVIHNF